MNSINGGVHFTINADSQIGLKFKRIYDDKSSGSVDDVIQLHHFSRMLSGHTINDL
jgi:hypothetical protein